MGEQGLGALAVGLAAEDAPAEGRAHCERRDIVARRTVAQPRGLADQLIEPRIDIIGKLDFRHGAQAVSPHPHRCTDDPAFRNRGIEHTVLAVLGLKPGGGAEHPAEIADILAHDDHIGITGQHDVERFVDRLDHVEAAFGARFGDSVDNVAHPKGLSVPNLVMRSRIACSACSSRCQGSSS